MATTKPPVTTDKAFPNVKTIILRENDPVAARTLGVPGVWSRSLDDDITLKEGDTVMLKSSFVDTKPPAQGGIINISTDDIAALSITTGMYWQDSGNGVPIEKYQIKDEASSTPGIDYTPGGVLPQMDQVLKSDIPKVGSNVNSANPNGQNYILQNEFSDFTNTKLYLNTASADQTGALVADQAVTAVTLTSGGSGYIFGNDRNVPTNTGASPASGLTIDYTINSVTPSRVESIKLNAPGLGYSKNEVVELNADAQHHDPTGTKATITINDVEVPMTLEMVPNSNYNPEPGNTSHQYFDYTLKNSLDLTAPYVDVVADATVDNTVPLITIGNLLQLNIASDPLNNNQFFVYPYAFSNQVPATATPEPNAHMAIIEAVNSSISGLPEWTFRPNKDWVRTANGVTSPEKQGWVFKPRPDPAFPTGLISFNSGKQSGTYRILIGFWAWVWFPGKTKSDENTYQAETTDNRNNKIYNYYSMELEYYAPGNSAGAGPGGVSKLTKYAKEWVPKLPAKGKPRLQDWYTQFTPFVDFQKAGMGGSSKVKPASIPDSPESIFPTPPAPTQKERNQGGNTPIQGYPVTSSGGGFVPVWFSNMIDTTSQSQIRQQRTSFPFIIYDQNPGLHLGKTDPDSLNFAPFRIATTSSGWANARKKDNMEDFEQSGFIQQDVRGCVRPNASGQYVPQGVPPIWAKGSRPLKNTTMKDVPQPKFAFNQQCVVSRPYIPGTGALMTPRTFTTKIADIPGVNIIAQEYTYAAWARTLTDALNKVPAVNLPLSNQPLVSDFPLNKPTYTSGRILSDTVQLGYQGRNFPSNRFGLGFDYEERPSAPDGFPVYDQEQLAYVQSEQPYWTSEDGTALFAYKGGVPAGPPPNPMNPEPSVNYATVDPLNGSSPQQVYVYGQNGAKWCGAEALSIVFNDEASAFEIVQMHSNMYSATSGSTVIKNFRSGEFGAAYPDGIQELTVADQTGGVYITDWQPKSLWETRMRFNGETKVSTGGISSTVQTLNTGDFSAYSSLADVTTTKTELIRGINITGNFRSGTDFIDKRVNIPTQQQPTEAGYRDNFIGGNYQSPVVPFNLETETNTPVTILGKPIIQTDIEDPFFLVEVRGINQNEIYGLDQPNSLITSIVGRYFATSNFTQGGEEGSIAYVHRGEPMLIKDLSIRILDSKGDQLTDDILDTKSAIVLEIAGQDISIVDAPPAEK